MLVDFGMAARYGGHCYLRFDDTNPEAEKQEYIDHIQEIVAWLGWQPWKVRLPQAGSSPAPYAPWGCVAACARAPQGLGATQPGSQPARRLTCGHA